jgi:hypothetical protein
MMKLYYSELANIQANSENRMQVTGKGEVQPRTGHEDPKGELRNSSKLSLN